MGGACEMEIDVEIGGDVEGDVLFVMGDWNTEVGNQEIPWQIGLRV